MRLLRRALLLLLLLGLLWWLLLLLLWGMLRCRHLLRLRVWRLLRLLLSL